MQTGREADAPYPPLYESSEAKIYKLLDPTEDQDALQIKVNSDGNITQLGSKLNNAPYTQKGVKIRNDGTIGMESFIGERAYIVDGLPNYLGNPYVPPAGLFSTSALDDYKKLNDEGKDYLKKLVLTTIRRRVNNRQKRDDIARAYGYVVGSNML